ncbi:hypothetical protein EJD96_09015 [Herbaspirillum seropedicae]|uniref:hypothetical protein n=1 Tax=Herbaspirillum seropedicae TaxID=964 RepID=UPI001123C2A7|nr:hypothetical protein [Herbaspirillum seropedicae]QDD64295.1 hypothetical protein EJD96_09015 [Herbaspirillum seropedicae]
MENWINDRAFVPQVGRCYQLYFGELSHQGKLGHWYAAIRADGVQPFEWIELETQIPLDPQLAAYVVRAYRELRAPKNNVLNAMADQKILKQRRVFEEMAAGLIANEFPHDADILLSAIGIYEMLQYEPAVVTVASMVERYRSIRKADLEGSHRK